MKHAYIPILVALVVTTGLINQKAPEAETMPLTAPSPVASAPLDSDLIVEVSLRF